MMIPTLYLNCTTCVTRTLRTVMVLSGDCDVPRFVESVWYIRFYIHSLDSFGTSYPLGVLDVNLVDYVSWNTILRSRPFQYCYLYMYMYTNNNIV
uniref:P11 protein n=1 Tax=Passion fruit green spot virus TaxID=989895 RepID=A0A5P9KG79_9VIRU|nr:P11 protein [Passion fruit green spot virus]